MKKEKINPETAALRVLILEDVPSDAELVQRALRRAGIPFSARVAKNRREFSAALAHFHPQVILSDFKLPGFDGMAALALARARAPEIPFIFVSGSIGEKKAVASLSRGAADYVFKDNLARLGPALKRGLAEAETRRQKVEAEKLLRESERMFSALIANLPGFVYRCRNDRDWTMEYISAGCREVTGYDPEDLIASRRLAFGDIIRADFKQPIRKELQRQLKRREPFEFEYAIRGASGEERWVWERGRGVFAADGKFLFLEGFITDISDRKKAELLKQQAQAEAERLRQALDRVPVCVYMKDTRSRYIYANQLTLDHFGCSADELPGSADSRFFPPTTVKKLRQIDRRVLAGESTVEEIVVPDSGKGERIFLEVKTPIYAGPQGGKAWGLLGISSDITEIRHQERVLHESEEKYRTLVTQSPDGIFIADLQGNFISVNQAMCSGLGYGERELLAMKIWDIVPERYRSLHEQRLAGLLTGKAGNDAAEYRVRARDGRERYVAILSAPYYRDRALVGFLGIARDITEKMEMEVRLRASEEFHRTLVETSPDAIITIDGGGRVTFASQKAMDLFAVPSGDDVLGTPVLDFVVPADAARVQDRLVEILSGSSLPEIREYRLRRRDKKPFWAEITSAPLRDSAGRNIGLLLVCRDISERRRIEITLRESEEKYRLIAENTADSIAVLDLDLNLTYVSPSIIRLRGYTVEEVLLQTLPEILTPDSLAKLQQVVAEETALEQSGQADPTRSRTLELQEYHRDGSVIWVENTISFLRDKEGKPVGFLAVAKDISERKEAEEQIRSSLREKEVLLQEIHHRVKNNLQIVSGLLTLQAGHAAAKSVDEMFHESQDRIRSIALVHESLYKSHNLAEIAFDDYLRSLIGELLHSYGIVAGRVAVTYETERIFLSIEKAIPLGLIVNELVTNSLKHAFPGDRRGEIRIGLHECRDNRHEGENGENDSQRHFRSYELTVADDGIGLGGAALTDPPKTLGLQLLAMLAGQLQSELIVEDGPGARFRLAFGGERRGAESGTGKAKGG